MTLILLLSNFLHRFSSTLENTRPHSSKLRLNMVPLVRFMIGAALTILLANAFRLLRQYMAYKLRMRQR